MGVANILEHPARSFGDSPNPMKDDLAWFNCRLEKSEKMSIMVDQVCAAAQDPWMKNVVSSAYCNKDTQDGTLGN